MKSLKYSLLVLLAISLCACGKKDETVNIEKEGTKYEIGDEVSFYYPKSFNVGMNNLVEDSTQVINFVTEDGTQQFYYTTISEVTDNPAEDLVTLYEGQLEETGVSNVKVTEPVLENGLKCYEFEGVVDATKIQFKNLVYFGDNKTYVYGYQAAKEDYQDNIKQMTTYLETFNLAIAKSK